MIRDAEDKGLEGHPSSSGLEDQPGGRQTQDLDSRNEGLHKSNRNRKRSWF